MQIFRLLLLFGFFIFPIVVFADDHTHHDMKMNKFEDFTKLPKGGEFTLMSAQGPVKLSDFTGKVIILEFGYLNCPDICPTLLRVTAAALAQLSEYDRNRVQVLFITLDPERDNLEDLNLYVHYFDKSFIALRGNPAEIKQVADLYGITYFKEARENSPENYVVNHNVASFVIGTDNVIRLILPHEVTSHDISSIIHELLGRHTLNKLPEK